MNKPGRALLLLLLYVLAVGGFEFRRAQQRDMPFDAARWRHPQWGWDRWRMVKDLQRVLESDRPTRAELLAMLYGSSEPAPGVDPTPDSLTYGLGKLPPGRSGSGEIIIYFGKDGRANSWQVHRDAF